MLTIVALGLAILLGWGLLLSLVAVAHNLGHLAMARLVGAGVARVSFGAGPAVLQGHDRHGTWWRLGLFPVFGAVDLKIAAEARDHPADRCRGRPLADLTRGKRLLVLLGGAGGNLVFSALLLFLLFSVFGQVGGALRIARVLPGSAAATAGLMPGDRITAVEGREVDSVATLAETLRAGASQDLRLSLLRDGDSLAARLTAPGNRERPSPLNAARDGERAGNQIPRDRGPIFNQGFLLDPAPASLGLARSLKLALWETAQLVNLPLTLLRRAQPVCLAEFPFGGGLCPVDAACRGAETVSGPCQRPTLTNRIFYPMTRNLPGLERQTLAAKTLYIFALLSLLYGVLSLLPLPGFDGGRILAGLAGGPISSVFESGRVRALCLAALFLLTALPILLGLQRNPWLVIILVGMATLLAHGLWAALVRNREGRLDAVHGYWSGLMVFMFLIIALAAPG